MNWKTARRNISFLMFDEVSRYDVAMNERRRKFDIEWTCKVPLMLKHKLPPVKDQTPKRFNFNFIMVTI